MTAGRADDVSLTVDLIAVDRCSLTVRDRADGRQHILAFDGLRIGAAESGDGYTLVLPRLVAILRGLDPVDPVRRP